MFWPDGLESLVMNQAWNSDVTYKEIQNEIYSLTKKKIGSNTYRKKPMKIRVLRTDWITNEKENQGLSDLI